VPSAGQPCSVVMLSCFVCWGTRRWTEAAVAVAAAVALLAPSLAADLAAVALIGFASFAFALFLRSSTLPPGSGMTAGYPFHAVVFGTGCRTPSTWRQDW
jgi:hypothetical protein